jgi:hypothetical protein
VERQRCRERSQQADEAHAADPRRALLLGPLPLQADECARNEAYSHLREELEVDGLSRSAQREHSHIELNAIYKTLSAPLIT